MLVQGQAYVIPEGDMLRVLVKLQFDPGAQKPADVPFEGLAKWLGQWADMTKKHVLWIEAYTT